jgi:TRAP-type mannitol/chloroaromatic compound transport system permease large subunit
MQTIFKGVLPFVIAVAVMMALLVVFPRMALFLPELMD